MSKGRIAVIGVSVLVLVATLLFAFIDSRGDVINAEVGDCVNVVSETDFETVDCSTEQAQYKVLFVVEGLSSGTSCAATPDYDSYISITGDAPKTVCLQTWLQIGDCVADDGSWVECGTSESAYEVRVVLADTQDDSQCPDETAVTRVYAGENNVICLAQTG